MARQETTDASLFDLIAPRSTPEMADLKGAFVAWLDILPYEHKARAWQMIGTVDLFIPNLSFGSLTNCCRFLRLELESDQDCGGSLPLCLPTGGGNGGTSL
jgi:hypothetical protein